MNLKNPETFIALDVQPFWTRGPWWDPVGVGIRWFSRTRWCRLAEVNHMGLEFTVSPRSNSRVFMKAVAESLGGEGFHVKVSKLDNWASKGGYLVRLKLPRLDVGDAQACWETSCQWNGKKNYDYPLIAKLAARGSVLGRLFNDRVNKNNLDMVDCSEAACAILAGAMPRYDVRLSIAGKQEPYGAITPQDALERFRAIVKGV